MFFWTVDAAKEVLQGFQLQAGADGALRGAQTWLLRFPAAQEQIVALTQRPAGESVHSSVRVLGGGEGGWLWKYLNPNLLALATVRGHTDGRVVPALKRSTDPSVNIYLIDAVSGAVLDKFVQRGAEGPVSLLLAENSLLAHYYSPAAGSYEVTSVELFEQREGSGPAANAQPIGSGGVLPNGGSVFDGSSVTALTRLGAPKVAPFDSFAAPPPQSVQQSFTFRSQLRALGITQTRRGIALKELLFALPTGELLALPRAFVDPRRPVADPTQQDKIEGLIPYSAELPVDPLRVVSHVQRVARVRGVVSAAALLESTSLVCAYGLDLFCTRVSPSQTFDLLNEDFNSPFLIATVSAVFLAIMLTRRAARAKEASNAWK